MKDFAIRQEKLKTLLTELAKETGGRCLESSVFIGEIAGKPVKVTVVAYEEARECHDYDGTDDRYNCIDV